MIKLYSDGCPCVGCDDCWTCGEPERPVSDSCQIPTENENYLECKQKFVSVWNKCVEDCPDNDCLKICSYEFDTHMANCPCGKFCPQGQGRKE